MSITSHSISPTGRSFCLLADAASYQACRWDLVADATGRAHWVDFFKRNLETILNLGRSAALRRGHHADEIARRADACRREFVAHFDAFATRPSDFGRVTILTMDQWRDRILRRHGFVDAFADLKNRENEKMLPLLPQVCRRLDAMAGAAQIKAVVEGVFAGNIFDMGAEPTAKKFADNSPDFFATIASLAPRPWLIDDLDALTDRLLHHRHRKAVFFVDNAGSDFILGATPMMRWLAQRGTEVVLAANDRPTLNDMTLPEVNAWWLRLMDTEPSLRDLPIRRVGTGTGEPLIDLSCVSDELNAAAEGADLVILEGMGRGVESNLDAHFSADALNLAMIKDHAVAQRCGGKVFDVVCRFRTALTP